MKRILQREDFVRYMNFQSAIVVILEDIHETGKIQMHNETLVKINGNYFVKKFVNFGQKTENSER